MEVRPVRNDISLSKLAEDLDKYAQFARDNGCTHVKIIESREVLLDYRAQLKCSVPKCTHYNTSLNCPPYAPTVEDMEKLVKLFRYALLVGYEVPSSLVTKGPNAENEVNKGFAGVSLPEVVAARKKIPDIVTQIESKAFYDGYYFATAFGAGPCKLAWCMNVDCQALTEGKPCRHPMLSRPSMEGCGIDVFGTVRNAGWEIYPIGDKCRSEDIPYGLRVGLVFIY